MGSIAGWNIGAINVLTMTRIWLTLELLKQIRSLIVTVKSAILRLKSESAKNNMLQVSVILMHHAKGLSAATNIDDVFAKIAKLVAL